MAGVPFSSFNYKKFGPQYLKDNGNTVLLCKDLLDTDTYAQALAKAIAQTPMAGTDVNITEVAGRHALTTINAKSGVDPSGTVTQAELDAMVDVSMAYCDSVVGTVILAVDVTDRVIVNEAGDTVDLPAGQSYSRALQSVAA